MWPLARYLLSVNLSSLICRMAMAQTVQDCWETGQKHCSSSYMPTQDCLRTFAPVISSLGSLFPQFLCGPLPCSRRSLLKRLFPRDLPHHSLILYYLDLFLFSGLITPVVFHLCVFICKASVLLIRLQLHGD